MCNTLGHAKRSRTFLGRLLPWQSVIVRLFTDSEIFLPLALQPPSLNSPFQTLALPSKLLAASPVSVVLNVLGSHTHILSLCVQESDTG
jgi:hypothetical protein